MTLSINQEISFQDPNDVTITGVVVSKQPVDSIEVMSDDMLLGATTPNPDGTWSFTVDFGDNGTNKIDARVQYKDSSSELSNLLTLAVGTPLDNQFVSAIEQANDVISATVYGPTGRALYGTEIVPGDNQIFADDEGRGGGPIAYTDFPKTDETIETFRAVGPQRDSLNLSDTNLQSLAAVLHHTTMSDGSATIHIDDATSVTLIGVTKQQLAMHPHELVFTGGHDQGSQPM